MKFNSVFLYYIGAPLILIAAIIQPMQIRISDWLPIAPALHILGALMVTIQRILQPIECDDKSREARFRFQLAVSSLLYFLSAYLMYGFDKRWVITLLIAAVIDLVVIFRLPEKKS